MSSSESEDMVISYDIGGMIGSIEPMPNVIPEKSKYTYELCYSIFTEWLKTKNYTTIDEKVMLEYFFNKSTVQKPSSMWTVYSKLRKTIYLNNNVDISTFTKLLAFLKSKSDGYVAKKSKVFTKNDIDKFLLEAKDEEYLVMKVALIIGVAGGYRRDELTKLSTKDVTDLGDMVVIVTKNTTTPKETIITNGCLGNADVLPFLRKYMSLRSDRTTHDRFFVSCRGGKCTAQPVGVNSIATIPKKIATFLGLKEAECYTGHCFRRSFDFCYTKPKIYPRANSTGYNSGYSVAQNAGEKYYVTSINNVAATSRDTNISGTMIKEEPCEDLDPFAASSFSSNMEFSEQESKCGNQRLSDGHYNHVSPTYDHNGSKVLQQDEISDSLATEEMKYFNSEVLKKIDVVVEHQQKQNYQLEKMNSNCEKMNSNFEKMNNNLETLIELLKGKFAS